MYQTVLFDVDGVMLSEERYFDASALTIHEWICSSTGLGLHIEGLPTYVPQPEEPAIRAVRSAVFSNDAVLDFMKSLGVNANWDMVYLQFMCQWIQLLQGLKAESESLWVQIQPCLTESWSIDVLSKTGAFLQTAGLAVTPEHLHNFLDMFDGCTDRSDMFDQVQRRWGQLVGLPLHGTWTEWLQGVYDTAVDTFQTWYLGDEFIPGANTGKYGFVRQEIPLVEPDALSRLFEKLVKKGIVLGVATGRPQIETDVPFQEYGWDSFFPKHRVSTASHVRQAEQAWPQYRPLSKPNPFSYLRSLLGTEDAKAAIDVLLPLQLQAGRAILVVGDSVADWKAAKAMGCHFAAVLTGLTGEAARETFEKLGSEYIVSNVLDLKHALGLV